MRHLYFLTRYWRPEAPKAIAELGPGPSLGTVLAALLCGAQRAYALDVTAHADSAARNLKVFEGLIHLFARRESIPCNLGLSDMRPDIGDYSFPEALSDELDRCGALSPARLDGIRDSILGRGHDVRYVAPWDNAQLVEPDSLDLIFSQAVLEHVDNLPAVYRTCRKWLRPGGAISHQIDFRCHGTARHWNGHYTYSDGLWKFLTRSRPYLINREPYSTHRRLLEENGFKLLHEERYYQPSVLKRDDLAPRFRHFEDDDLTTSGLYILARKL